MAGSDQMRRPSGLMRQLDWLWDRVTELCGQGGESTNTDQTPTADPGDLEVYFENGLTG